MVTNDPTQPELTECLECLAFLERLDLILVEPPADFGRVLAKLDRLRTLVIVPYAGEISRVREVSVQLCTSNMFDDPRLLLSFLYISAVVVLSLPCLFAHSHRVLVLVCVCVCVCVCMISNMPLGTKTVHRRSAGDTPAHRLANGVCRRLRSGAQLSDCRLWA